MTNSHKSVGDWSARDQYFYIPWIYTPQSCWWGGSYWPKGGQLVASHWLLEKLLTFHSMGHISFLTVNLAPAPPEHIPLITYHCIALYRLLPLQSPIGNSIFYIYLAYKSSLLQNIFPPPMLHFDWKYFLRLIRVSGVLVPEKKLLFFYHWRIFGNKISPDCRHAHLSSLWAH